MSFHRKDLEDRKGLLATLVASFSVRAQWSPPTPASTIGLVSPRLPSPGACVISRQARGVPGRQVALLVSRW